MSTPNTAPAASRPRCSVAPVVEPFEPRQLLSATTVTISTTREQTIDGFGTSLGGTTSMALIQSAAFQKAYYKDLGASMFRVALNPWLLQGKTSKGTRSMAEAVEMGPHIAANIRQFNFSDPNIVKYGTLARASLKYGSDVKIIGSVWSPPYWMKSTEVNPSTGKPTGVQPTYNNTTDNTSGGSLIDTDANLTQFGRYVAAYVKGFEEAFGVHLYAISIQNELAFHESYSSAVYSPQLYVDALKAVGRWFKKDGIDTKIEGPEDVGVGSTTDRGILERQMAYVSAVRADPEAMDDLDIYAIHGYAADNTTGGQRSPEMWSEYVKGHKGTSQYNTWVGIKNDHKSSWMTETSGFSSTWNSSMRLAGSIQDALVYGNVSGYVYWGISNTSPSGEALTSGTNYKANKYSVFKQFSQYIRPGAARLATTGGDPYGVYVSAFADDSSKTLTTVLENQSTSTQTLHLKLGDINVSSFTTGYASTAAFTWRKLKTLKVRGGELDISMPPQSIFTLQGLVEKPQEPGSISGVYFNDTNKNGKKDAGESGIVGDKIFLDLNDNGVRDAHEPFVVTTAGGQFTFKNVEPGTYRVRREVPSGYQWTTARPSVTVASGATVSGVLVGIAKTATTPTPPASGKASLSGHAFNDDNADGRQETGETDATAKTVFLDTNNNGTLDSGEQSTTTDASGDFSFTNLSPGTYHVRRVFGSGYTYSTAKIDVTLTAGEKKTGLTIGSKTR